MNIYGLKPKGKRIIGALAALIAVFIAVLVIINNTDTVPRMNRILGADSAESDYIRFLDVGQGDCILVHSNGKNVIIDSGVSDSADALCSKLGDLEIRHIDAAIVTHYHMDHVGGLSLLAERYYIKSLLLPFMGEEQEGTSAAKAAIEVVKNSGGAVYTIVEGMTVDVGDFEITALQYAGELEDENDRSIVLMAEIEGKRFLLTADIEHAAESVLLDAGIDIKCDVLKVAHHGSSTSTSVRFIKTCAPEHAVISCGRNNDFGHPHDDTLALIDKNDIKLHRTDMLGDITFHIENGELRIETEK